MNVTPLFIVISSVVLTSVAYSADILSGDEKLSCEALLCLSSGQRPSECNPSLDKYFSINHKKLSKTIRKRKEFLDICPTGDYVGRDAHISAIAAGGGRCDMQSLLSYLNSDYSNGRNPFGPNGFVGNQQQRSIPSYCTALYDNQYTDGYQLPVLTTSCSKIATPFGYTNKCKKKWIDPTALPKRGL